MNARTNLIAFSNVNYTNEANLMAAVMQQLTILVRAGYTCAVKDLSGRGTIIGIEYSNVDPDFGDPQLCWLYPDEIEYLQVYQDKIQFEIAKRTQEELAYVENKSLFDIENVEAKPEKKDEKKNNKGGSGGSFEA